MDIYADNWQYGKMQTIAFSIFHGGHMDNQNSASLARALKIFSPFFDLIHQPISVIDRNGNFIYYNKESAEADGYPHSAAVGKHLLEVLTNLDEEKSTMLTSLKTGKVYVDNFQSFCNFHGRVVDYQHTTVPIYDKSGKIEGVIEIGRDLSSMRKLQQQVVELNRQLYRETGLPAQTIITGNSDMRGLINKAQKLAGNDMPVVVIGETGTGKELFARLVHSTSHRAQKPLIALNCSALPVPLIESSLFGTVKGAFTGAENTQGYLEIANGGTLFLDELNSMPLEIQGKLLRFLQDGSFWRLGDNRPLRSDVRIIAAMNESPTELIKNKLLRADLFYRLGVGILSLPPLRARPEDIEPLTHYFIEKHGDICKQKIHGIGKQALVELKSKSWPGNVRMLENVILRSLALQEHAGVLDTIVTEEETFSPPSPAALVETAPVPLPAGTSLAQQTEEFERRLIVNALNQTAGNVSRAALALRIPRATLHAKIARHRIQVSVV